MEDYQGSQIKEAEAANTCLSAYLAVVEKTQIKVCNEIMFDPFFCYWIY